MTRTRLTVALLLLALTAAACAHVPGAYDTLQSATPVADSVTLGLWHLDESGGNYAEDSGPLRMRAVAGADTHTDFGRLGNARVFMGSLESWVFVRYNDALNSQRLTVEAWIEPQAYGTFEDTPIAGRWNEYPTEQSWLFSLVGLQREGQPTNITSPGYHESLVIGGTTGHLMFAFQPVDPGPPRVYFSTTEVPLERWTRVAVTLDGAVVKFWINGQLDAQYATRGTIRDSAAPLLIGNYFDSRRLTDFGGQLRIGTALSIPPVYAFQGLIDEVRLSSQARDFGAK